MDERQRVIEILKRLDEHYGTDPICYLNYETPWQLLIAVILSAQCKDERVNQVTAKLFVKYPSLETLAAADVAQVEQEIHMLGFHHSKAKNIVACAKRLVTEYGKEVPRRMEELITLAGVGRKTANVIRGNIYHDPSIVVDTHVKRISKRLGFTTEQDAEKVEYDLMQVLPKEHWILYNMQIITHGRRLCPARSPKCGECFLNDLCPSGDCFWYRKYEK
ncbi:MAG: endonuclease III [Lachnospiraceae bacterium]|nr:endonuclease III [Lachnospiraceae bacterium]